MVAYVTEAGGAQQLAVRNTAGGNVRIVTHFSTGVLYHPVFEPDGKSISFSDSEHRLWFLKLEGDEQPSFVTKDIRNEILDQSFLPDAQWLAFSMSATKSRRDPYLFNIFSRKLVRIGPGESTDENPIWSDDGKYLYFTSRGMSNLPYLTSSLISPCWNRRASTRCWSAPLGVIHPH